MSEKTKIRVSITMPKLYRDILDRMIEEEIYLNRGEVILDALRKLFKDYGVDPFCTDPEMVDKTPGPH